MKWIHPSLLFILIGANSSAQMLIDLPKALPTYGSYFFNFHEAITPYWLTDTTGTDLTWNLGDLEWNEQVFRTDSVMPPDTTGRFSLFQGATLTVFKPTGDERSWLKLQNDTLWMLGAYSPYDDRLDPYATPVPLWWAGMETGATCEFDNGSGNMLRGRREVVATGRLNTPFGSFGDLVMMKVWRDREEPAECYELVSPENALAPIAQFWSTGAVYVFERVGFEGVR